MATKKNAIAGVSEEQLQDILTRFAAGETLSRTESYILRQLQAANPELFRTAAARRSSSRPTTVSRSSVPRAVNDAAQGTPLQGLNQSLLSHNYGTQKVTSPGGFKKSGQDIDSDTRRAGHRTPEAVASRMVKIDDRTGKVLVRNGHGGVTLNRDQVQYILNRGSRGGTMTPDMQMVYDAFVQRDERRNAAEIARRTKEEQDAAADRAAAQKQAEEEYKAKVALQKLQEQNRLAIAKDRAAYDLRAPERAETARKNREAMLEKKLKSKRFDHSPDQMKDLEELRKKRREIVKAIDIDDFEKSAKVAEIDKKIDDIWYDPEPVLKPPMSLDEQFDNDTVVRDGIRYGRSGDDWKVVHDGKTASSQAKKDEATEKRRQDLDDKRNDYIRKRYDSYVDTLEHVEGETEEELRARARKLAQTDADVLFGSPTPSPTPPPPIQQYEPSPSDDIESEDEYQLNPSTDPAQSAPPPTAADFAKNNDVLGYLKAKKEGVIAQPAQPAATQQTAAQPAAVQQPPLAQATEAQPTEPEQPVQQPQDNVQGDQQYLYGKCPECCAALTPDGTCPTCGWPNSQQTQTVQPTTETPAPASDATTPLQS